MARTLEDEHRTEAKNNKNKSFRPISVVILVFMLVGTAARNSGLVDFYYPFYHKRYLILLSFFYYIFINRFNMSNRISMLNVPVTLNNGRFIMVDIYSCREYIYLYSQIDETEMRGRTNCADHDATVEVETESLRNYFRLRLMVFHMIQLV